MIIRQSTSIDVAIGPFLDSGEGNTVESALTLTQPDIRLKKNGGNWAQKAAAQTLSHEEAGWYEVTLDATDTDTVGQLIVAVHESGALPVWREFQVVEEAIYDALFAASAAGFDANQRVNVGRWLNQAVTLSDNNRPDVNVDEISDDTGAPANLEAMFDGAGYAGGTTKLDVNLVTWRGTQPNTLTSGRVEVLVGAMASGAIAAASFAANALDAVWSTATRVLTAATNIANPIADQVWDEAISGHLGAGSTGAKLGSVSGAGGAGAISWDVLIQVGATPVQAAAVWVSTDAGGANVVAGTLITPSNGTVTFLLDAGTYYAWVRKDGLNPVNGQAFAVS